MKIIANIMLAIMMFFATIFLWFQAVGYMGFESFEDLWARFSGNGNFIPWEINLQYLLDWISYYWTGWVWSGVGIVITTTGNCS